VKPPRPNSYRDAWCGSLDAAREGERARVAGWVHRRRDHGGLIFIDLRDRSGLLQLVFHPDRAPDAHERAHRLRSEDVVSAEGAIARRAPENVNPNMPTGEVELEVAEFDLLGDAETPPFPIDEDVDVDELLRMRHRYLDLRRERQRETLLLRHRVAQQMRRTLDERDFIEIETPVLTRSTPEGARDFLVPSRKQPGSFYALPQSPQLFKQLLMVAGFERYFQIARCFRDEDPRADRQPEFTQLDLEMSFIEEDDVIEVVERVMADVFELAGFDAPAPPWPRMPYDEAIARYGVDRPDHRFGLEIVDVGDVVAGSEFQVFAKALKGGGVVRALNAGARQLPRSELDALTEEAIRMGAGGLVWAFVEEDGGLRSPIAKFLSEAEIAGLRERLDAGPGDLILVVADAPAVAARVLGNLRLALAERFDLIPIDRHDLVWVVDFPMFEWNETESRWDPLHHPFTGIVGSGDEPPNYDDPASLRSRAYDLVLDGFEIGGGSIRNHELEVQQRVFELIGIDGEEARARFGFLLDALRAGAPPHGGIAMGFDRIVALLAGWRTAREVDIREVITFPKTATGLDPLTGAPAPVDEHQLRELGLRTIGPTKGPDIRS
jgi:aspartyl-tRNA synthetase